MPDTIVGTYDLEKKVEDTVILVELTQSNYGDPNRAVIIEEAIQELLSAKQRLGNSHRFALVGFGEKAEILLDFENFYSIEDVTNALYQKAKILGTHSSFIAGLKQAFNTTIKSMQKLAEGKMFRIIIISEGNFIPEKESWEQLADTATKIGLMIDAVKLGNNQDPTLKRVTRSTLGDYVECSIRELKSWLPSFAALKKSTNVNQTEGDKNLKGLLELVAAPLKTVREQVQKPKDLLALMNAKDQSSKCGICYSPDCMICKGPPFACGSYCPNCSRFFHLHCAAGWAESQKDMPTNVFKCPVCFSLLKVPGELNRVKVLKGRLKDSFLPSNDRVDVDKIKANELGENWQHETCVVCGGIFETADDDVLICGNKECSARYHPQCLDNIEQVHQGRCRVCDMSFRRKFDARKGITRIV